jgi:hypothetical protein
MIASSGNAQPIPGAGVPSGKSPKNPAGEVPASTIWPSRSNLDGA